MRVTLMAPAPAVDKWGADGFVTKLPPAGVLMGYSKIFPTKRPTDPRIAPVWGVVTCVRR